MRDPFTYLHKAAKRYGDVFRVPMPGVDVVIVNHPDLVRDVFHDRTGERFGVPPVPKRMLKIVGEPFPLLDGQPYTTRRRLITPMFGKRFLAGLADDFVDEMTTRLDAWDQFADTGKEIDLQHELAKILLPAFMRNMFSTIPTDEQVHTYDRDLREMLAMFASFQLLRRPPNILPIPGTSNLPVSTARMLTTVNQILDRRAKDPAKHQDLLQILVDAHLPDGTPLRRKDLIFDTTGILVAGYDTVVTALSWMFSLLPTNPQAQQRLYAEVDTLDGATPTTAHLPELDWAKQCFDEAQRLQGHPLNPRFAKADTELAGYRIPKGTLVGACMTALHRDPRWWATPEQFDPTHFDKDQTKARPNTAFIPFGTGSHQCVGMAMAYQNAQLLTALIYQRYRIQLRPGWTPTHQNTQSVIVRGGVPCTLTRR
jgi:cytochrome P450